MRVIFYIILIAALLTQSCVSSKTPDLAATSIPEPSTPTTKRVSVDNLDYYPIEPCTAAQISKSSVPSNPPKKNLIQLGVLNGRVKCGRLPIGEFTEAENVDKLSVDVICDEKGQVTSAKSDQVNKSLSKSLEDAARSTNFMPLLLGGDPMKVHGVLLYKYAKGRGFWLHRFER